MTEPHEVVPFDPKRTMPPEAPPRTIEQRAGAVMGATAEDGFERLVSYLEQRDAKPAKQRPPASAVAVVALALSIVVLVGGLGFIVKHELGSADVKSATRDLVDVVFDHAECSEESFRALAKNEVPAKCPSRARKRDNIDRNLNR